MPTGNLTMLLLRGNYGICRLEKTEQIPGWLRNGEFFSITKTADELSIVCAEEDIPDAVKCEKDWRALKIEGPLDFALTGILASVSAVLAQKKISIFAISTYDTDYILVKGKDIDNAIIALKYEGYEIIC